MRGSGSGPDVSMIGDVVKFTFATSQTEIQCVPKCRSGCPKLMIDVSQIDEIKDRECGFYDTCYDNR